MYHLEYNGMNDDGVRTWTVIEWGTGRIVERWADKFDVENMAFRGQFVCSG